MLIALTTSTVLLLFFGVSGREAEVWESQITAVQDILEDCVADAERLEKASAVVDAMRKELDDFAENVRATRQEFVKLDASYESTREDYQQVFQKLEGLWVQVENKLIDRRFELRDQLTREEWAALYDALKKRLEEEAIQ